MATEKIKLFEADIDVDGVIKKSIELKQEMSKLLLEQQKLKATTGDTSKEYVKSEAQLKKVRAEYNLNQKQVQNLSDTNGNALKVNDKLNLAMQREVLSVNNAIKNNKELRLVRNDINATTDEGREAIEEINKKIDENTEFVTANGSALEKLKNNVGNYKKDIIAAYNELEKSKEALENEREAIVNLQKETKKGSDQWSYYETQLNQTNTQINVVINSMNGMSDEAAASSVSAKLLSGDFKGLADEAKNVGGAGNLATKSLKGTAKGFIGLAKASLAFIATPVGAVIAALVFAFLLVKNAMNRSEKATQKITRIFSAFGGIIDTVLKALEPLGDFLIDVIVNSFELAGQAAEFYAKTVSKALRFVGLDDAADAVDDFTKATKEATKAGLELADAEYKLEKAQRQSQLVQLEYQKNAEKLRQIRDDENLSIRERIAANDELGVVLKNQLADELRIAEQALLVANLRIQAEGQTKEALDGQAEALTTIADIQERITGQESEQLTNRVSLQREAADKRKEIADKAIAQQEAELELFIQQQGVRAKSVKENLAILKETYKRELEILKANLKNKNITQTEFDAEFLKLQNDLAQGQSDIAVEQAQRELDIYVSKNQAKIDSETFFSDESLRIEQERLDNIAKKQTAFFDKQLEKGVINQQQYNDAIDKVDEEKRLGKESAQTLRDEAEQEKKIIDLENQRIIDEENFLTEFEIQSQRLETNRQQELDNAKNTNADIDKINRKFDLRQDKLDKQQQLSKIQNTQNAFNEIAGLLKGFFGENKGLNIALATADMFLGIQKAYISQLIPGDPTSLPRATIAGVKAGVFGAANVAKVAGVKFEKGGVMDIGGKRHSAGGTKFFGEDGTNFEAEKGEKMFILNRQASAALQPLLSNINQKYGGASLGTTSSYLEAGGQILRGASTSNSSIDMNAFKDVIIDAVATGSEIGSYKGASEGTHTGNAERIENMLIEDGANFG